MKKEGHLADILTVERNMLRNGKIGVIYTKMHQGASRFAKEKYKALDVNINKAILLAPLHISLFSSSHLLLGDNLLAVEIEDPQTNLIVDLHYIRVFLQEGVETNASEHLQHVLLRLLQMVCEGDLDASE